MLIFMGSECRAGPGVYGGEAMAHLKRGIHANTDQQEKGASIAASPSLYINGRSCPWCRHQTPAWHRLLDQRLA
jgi:hypothetical protein